MRCPRCETVVMEEIDRSGVTLDRCPSCRGIWLDRGELEKITARANSEFEQYRGSQQPQFQQPHDSPRYRDSEPPSSRQGHHKGHYKKKSFWHELFDD